MVSRSFLQTCPFPQPPTEVGSRGCGVNGTRATGRRWGELDTGPRLLGL